MDKSKYGNTATNMNQSKQGNTLNAASTMKKPSVMGQTANASKNLKKTEKSSEEEIMALEIQQVEIARLAKVFDQLRMASETYGQGGNSSSKDNFNNSNNNISSAQIKDNNQSTTKDNNANKKEGSEGKDYFTAKDVAIVLHDLGYVATKAEIEQMIWEVDENLDNKVNSYEFNLMYRRCRYDKTGLEPRNLYNLVQFLMYLKSDTNVNSSSGANTAVANNEQSHQKKTITVEDTLELLYVRFGRQNLDYEIEEIFGKEEKNAQGEEKSITLKEFLDKQRKRDFAERKKLEAERKKVKMPEKEDDGYGAY
ncbi:hypothetical protein ABPG72_013458 [Tetrahymena utriculariae]